MRNTQEDLRRAVEHLRSREPIAYGLLEKEDTVLSAVIAGRSETRPALLNVAFRWLDGQITTSRPNSPEGTFLGLGRATAAFTYLGRNPNFLAGSDIGEAFTALVDMQAKDTPSEVGAPRLMPGRSAASRCAQEMKEG